MQSLTTVTDTGCEIPQGLIGKKMRTRFSKRIPAAFVFLFLTIHVWLWALPGSAQAQSSSVVGANLKRITNGVLVLMGYSLVPDVTTGSLSFSNAESGNPGFSMTSLGAGFTVSKDVPLYLEGTAAYSRFDPTFVVSDGTDSRSLPVKWNTISATVGIGWDFHIAQDLVLRPIANFSYGHVESDLKVAAEVLENKTGRDISFLDNGQLDAAGVGGSIMLDYERYRPENEIDMELRYTNIYLQSVGNTSEAVQGSAYSQSLSLWTRWRAPTGLTALDRPFRYVLEFSHTQFLGDLRGALGFNWLTAVGAGFELDTSNVTWLTTRWRLIGRYKFGDNVQGWSVGVACSF